MNAARNRVVTRRDTITIAVTRKVVTRKAVTFKESLTIFRLQPHYHA